MKSLTVPAFSTHRWVAAFVLTMAIAFSASMPVAQAQTTASLQSQIAALLAQIQSLQAQLSGGGASTSAACPFVWTRNLTVGSSGPDVLRLQQFLNSDPMTRIAFVGVGAPGMESQYYGPLTAAAVSKFQTQYRSEVLSPSGLVNPTGFFGPSSRAKMNALCVTMPTVPTTPTTPTTPPTDNNGGSVNELGGDEASLDRFKVSSGDDTNLEEGQDAKVMDVEFRVEDGDIRISRIDVAVDHQLGDEDDPWDTFEEVSLWFDNKLVARMDTDNRRTWTENQPYSGAYRIRFTGLDIVVREDNTARFTVGVSLQNSIDGANTGLSWDIFIPDNGIRARDGERVDHSIGDNGEKVNIDINKEGSEDELAIRSSTQDPEATTLPVDESRRSDWYTIFAFDLDTDDSRNDIEINELPVSFTVSTATVATFLDDVRLVIDGKQYDDVTITNNGELTNYMVFDFDRNDFVIDAGDRVTVRVEARFKALASQYEGVTVRGTASSTSIDAEGADDLRANQLSGTATGETHTLRTQGVIVSSEDTNTRTQGQNDTIGIFTIKFEVTAFENDFYVAEYATTSSDTSNGGVMFGVEGPNGFEGIMSSVLSSTGEEDTNGVFTVREGETETFTLLVTVDPDMTGQYRLVLSKLYFSGSTNGLTNVQAHTMIPQSEYRTNYQNINN